ncbi:MAG TPA: hypothetical protein VH333_13455 [Pseudonocardiaceae bacterium]|nr:hypothetical protein [Pseudonocardiaceae bacterium]
MDPTALARHAGEFPTLADRARAIHTELVAALTAAGPCWGDDEAGRSFADGHVQPAGQTLDLLGTLPGQLADVGDRFSTTASAYQQSDRL